MDEISFILQLVVNYRAISAGARLHQGKIEKPMGVVIGRTEDLAADKLFRGRGDMPIVSNIREFYGLAMAHAPKRGAVSPQ
ncbi:hypothetical protein D3C80_1473620 [compost metagenome]